MTPRKTGWSAVRDYWAFMFGMLACVAVMAGILVLTILVPYLLIGHWAIWIGFGLWICELVGFISWTVYKNA